MRKTDRPGTRAIHVGSSASLAARTVSPPVQRASTVLMPDARSLYDASQISYGRAGLQPHGALKEALCDLEDATSAHLYPSGLAAMTGAMLALLSGGDEVLVVDCIYGPTRRFCDRVLARYGVTVRYFDPALTADEVAALFTPATRLLALEAPGSLTFDMQDIPALAAKARAAGVRTLIDNTWGAGLFFQPLAHGVDVSVQALTKYVGGHSDVFMGAAMTADPACERKLEDGVLHLGWSVSPDDAYQMLRGVRTLPTRLARHQDSALDIASWLKEQPGVQAVLCPGLPGDRGHAIWTRDFRGQNGLVSLVLDAAPESAVHAFLDALELFGLGFSWGGYESLAIHCDPQFAYRQRRPDYPGPVVRLHVGLEDAEDLKADLAAGLAAFLSAK